MWGQIKCRQQKYESKIKLYGMLSQINLLIQTC